PGTDRARDQAVERGREDGRHQAALVQFGMTNLVGWAKARVLRAPCPPSASRWARRCAFRRSAFAHPTRTHNPSTAQSMIQISNSQRSAGPVLDVGPGKALVFSPQ